MRALAALLFLLIAAPAFAQYSEIPRSDDGIGKVYMARGLCFKSRPGIGKYPDGPMQPGEQYKLNVEATTIEPAYDAAYLWLAAELDAPLATFDRRLVAAAGKLLGRRRR